MFLLRKKKSGYPKECIMFAEKTDSESSCLLFEKEKRLSERMNCVCKKYALRPLGGTAEGQNIMKDFLRFFPSPSGCPLGGGAPFLSFGHFSRFIGKIHRSEWQERQVGSG